MISPTLHTAAVGALELAVNQALRLDPAAAAALQTQAGKVFQLQCSAPVLDLFLLIDEQGLRLASVYEYKPDTRLKGRAADFMQLALADDPASALINGKLELYGDSQGLIQLQQIARNLDLDWEAPLSDLFGDVLGHQLGRGLRHGAKTATHIGRSLKRQLQDYLSEESELLTPRALAEPFFHDIDQLALRAERLEARLRKLRSAASTSQG